MRSVFTAILCLNTECIFSGGANNLRKNAVLQEIRNIDVMYKRMYVNCSVFFSVLIVDKYHVIEKRGRICFFLCFNC